MKISEAQYSSFLEDLRFREVCLPSTGESFQMPLIGKKAIQMASFHAASRSAVMDVLPAASLVPALLDEDQTIVGVIAVEYLERNLEKYSEVLVVIPVRIGEGKTPPTLEELVSDDMGDCTLLVRHIGVTTRTAEVVGNELLGYAKFIADINFLDMPDERICTFANDGQEILRFSVGVSHQYGDYERNTLSLCTVKDASLYRLACPSQSRFAVDAPQRNVLILGDHPLGRSMARLKIDEKPLLSLYSPYFQLISDNRQLSITKLQP